MIPCTVIPLVIYEIKPLLSNPPDVNYVVECLLQGYYSLKTYGLLSTTVCLTDFQSWYYYSISDLESVPLVVVRVRKIVYQSQVPTLEEVMGHLNFLIELCTEDQ